MDLYYESAAVLLAMISLGKYFEARSVFRTTDAVRALMHLAPDTAALVDGKTERPVAVAEIEPGDLLRIRPGERIPVDGEVAKRKSQKCRMPLSAFYRNFDSEHIKIILMIKLRNYFTLSTHGHAEFCKV